MFNQKLYDIVMRLIVSLHFITVLICSKNIFNLIISVILSIFILKIVLTSSTFILSVPYVTDDEVSKLNENGTSLKLMTFHKIKKVNNICAIIFSIIFLSAALYVYINNICACFMYNQTFEFIYFIGISFFLGAGLGLLKSVCLKNQINIIMEKS